jgi:hypothetical protein
MHEILSPSQVEILAKGFEYKIGSKFESMTLKLPDTGSKMLPFTPKILAIAILGTHPPSGVCDIITTEDINGRNTNRRSTIDEMVILYQTVKLVAPENKLTQGLYYELVESIDKVKAELGAQISSLEALGEKIRRY